MRARLVIILWPLSIALSLQNAQAKGPFGSIRIGNWSGGAYTNDATGEFSHCSAGATYQSGIQFFVSMTAQGGWMLGFGNPAWQFNPGEVIPIDVTFDGQAQYHVLGTVHLQIHSLVVVPMPTNSALLRDFRKSNGMTAVAKGSAFGFNLTSTSQLLPALTNCVAAISKRGLSAAADFSIRPPPRVTPQPAPATAPAVTSSLKTEASEGTSQEFQVEAIQLASNFILKSALQNPRVLGRAETPVELSSSGAAWKADEASGLVRIIPQQGDTKGIDVATAIAAADSKECKGKFASGRISELVDNDVVFRGYAVCDDSDGPRTAEYFIVPRRKGGFVMLEVAPVSWTGIPAR